MMTASKSPRSSKASTTIIMNVQNVLIFGTAIRLIICILCTRNVSSSSNEIRMYGSSMKRIEAILIDPLYSLSQFREMCYLSRLYMNGMLHFSNGGSSTGLAAAQWMTKPSSILALMDRLLAVIEDIIPLNVMFGIITILIDVGLTIQLFRLAGNVITCTTTDKVWEANLERFMNPRIHPNLAWVFGVRFGQDFKKSDLDSNSNTDDNDMNTESTTIKTTLQEKNGNHNKTSSDNDEKQQQRQPIINLSDVPQLCTIIYYLNPLTILSTSIFPSFQGVQYLLLVTIFQQVTTAIKSDAKKIQRLPLFVLLRCTCFLAILTYFEFYYVIFLAPLFFWCTRNNHYIGDERTNTGNKTNQQHQNCHSIGCKFIQFNLLIICIISFHHFMATGAMTQSLTFHMFLLVDGTYTIASYVTWYLSIKTISLFLSAANSTDGIFSSSFSILSNLFNNIGRSHDSLSPNIGLQWYLFMNLFGRCRQFFVVSTKCFPYLFFFPFSVRFYRYPLAMVSLYTIFIL